MPIIDSSSSLIIFSDYVLNNIQSISLSVDKNNLQSKSIGNNKSLISQFVDPEITLNISYNQTSDLINEMLLGFYLIFKTPDSTSETALNKFFNKFKISRSCILISDEYASDLINKINKNGFSDKFSVISLINLYLNSYSLSYSSNQLAIVNCSFSTSENKSKISKLSKYDNDKYSVTLRNGGEYPINNDIFTFVDKNLSLDKYLVYSSKYFAPSNVLDASGNNDLNIFGVGNLDVINKLDFSIDFNRPKHYFLSSLGDYSTGEANRENLILPIKYSLNISGISTYINATNITYLNNNDFYTYIIKIGDLASTDKQISYSTMVFENLIIKNFNYSLDVNGKLNYSISFTGEINTTSGYKIFNKLGVIDSELLSFDGTSILDANGSEILVSSDATINILKNIINNIN